MIKAIIFDFFDVIRTDAYKAWIKQTGRTMEGPWADAAHQQDIGNFTTQQFLERLSELHGSKLTRNDIDNAATVDQDVVALLSHLQKEYALALVSNAPSALIREILAEHDLEKYFKHIIVSSEVGMVKPSPDIFYLVLDKLGVQAHEAVFIDDNERYVEAARKLGIHGIHFISAVQLKTGLVEAGVTL